VIERLPNGRFNQDDWPPLPLSAMAGATPGATVGHDQRAAAAYAEAKTQLLRIDVVMRRMPPGRDAARHDGAC